MVLGYYLSTQAQWMEDIKVEWKQALSQFVRVLKNIIGKLTKNTKEGREASASRRVSLRMPNLQVLSEHKIQTMNMFGFLGALEE